MQYLLNSQIEEANGCTATRRREYFKEYFTILLRLVSCSFLWLSLCQWMVQFSLRGGSGDKWGTQFLLSVSFCWLITLGANWIIEVWRVDPLLKCWMHNIYANYCAILRINQMGRRRGSYIWGKKAINMTYLWYFRFKYSNEDIWHTLRFTSDNVRVLDRWGSSIYTDIGKCMFTDV